MPDTAVIPTVSDPLTLRLANMSKAEFIMLAKLAWLDNPNESLATQMSIDTNVKVRTCQYWLSLKDSRKPYPDIVRRAYDLATPKFNRYADLLDRLDGLETAAPAD